MSKSKKVTKVKEPKDYTRLIRMGYILAFAGSLSISSYLAIMINNPDKTQLVLAGVSTLNAVYFFIKATK